jgi:hypothetical protein
MESNNQRTGLEGWQLGTSFNLASPPDLDEIKQAGIECIEFTWRPRNLDIFDPNPHQMEHGETTGSVQAVPPSLQSRRILPIRLVLIPTKAKS